MEGSLLVAVQKGGLKPMYKILERIYYFIADNWKKKKYAISILVVVSILLTIIGIGFICYQIISFIAYNLEGIATLVVCSTIIILLFTESRKERLNKKREEQERVLAEKRAMQEQADIKAIEENYKMLSRILFTALQKVSEVLGLKAVSTESDIENPVHHINMGDFYLYQFVIYRKNKTMEVDLLREVLQDEISRIIGTGQVYGLQKMTHYLYNGQFYPCVIVHHIDENVAYLQLSLAIASEGYFRHKQMQQTQNLATLRDNATIRSYDKDF